MADEHLQVSEEEKLRRIVEMIGVRSAKQDLVERKLFTKGLNDTGVVNRYMDNIVSQAPNDFLDAYDFITRPFSLHLFRIYLKSDSPLVPTDFGQWDVVDSGTVNKCPAFKLERQVGKSRRRTGFFRQEEFVEWEKAVVVLRVAEGIVEIRAPYNIAREIADLLKIKMKLQEVRPIILNEKQYGDFLAYLRAAFEEIEYGASTGPFGKIKLKMRPGQTITADREVSVHLGAEGTQRAEQVNNNALLRNAGWANVQLGAKSFKCQIYRERGTFASMGLLSEQEVQIVVDGFKLATGLGNPGTAAD